MAKKEKEPLTLLEVAQQYREFVDDFVPKVSNRVNVSMDEINKLRSLGNRLTEIEKTDI